MAKGKATIQNFIKAADTIRSSSDITDDNLSSVDVGKDFVPVSLQFIHTLNGTNVVSVKNRIN